MKELPLWRVPARWQWRMYRVWHLLVHVGLGRYRYFCHYCAERDERLGLTPRPPK